MAIKFFDCKGYGQIEPSQTWFNRAGMVEAQCFLDPAKFASTFPVTPAAAAEGKIVAENGAFLMVDNVAKIATIPNSDMDELGYKMGINYSTERIYNQYTPGRRNFCMIAGEFLPRIGFVEPGRRICTNAVAWDTTDARFASCNTSAELYAKVKELIATDRANYNAYLADPATNTYTPAPIYAYVVDGSQGKLVIGANKDDALGKVYAQIVEAYYNADNTDSFKIMFVEEPQN